MELDCVRAAIAWGIWDWHLSLVKVIMTTAIRERRNSVNEGHAAHHRAVVLSSGQMHRTGGTQTTTPRFGSLRSGAHVASRYLDPDLREADTAFNEGKHELWHSVELSIISPYRSVLINVNATRHDETWYVRDILSEALTRAERGSRK